MMACVEEAGAATTEVDEPARHGTCAGNLERSRHEVPPPQVVPRCYRCLKGDTFVTPVFAYWVADASKAISLPPQPSPTG